ncbi:MAG: nitroreductase/quinone reductase family protein, partial [Pseudomonadota bacterium]|nr:nitroreductase/quinone reductase family protein [Pseudomonadota bacterium]
YNLRSHPDVEIRDHEKVIKMRVREVESDPERQQLWDASVEAYPPYEEYQDKTSRKIPVFIAEPH